MICIFLQGFADNFFDFIRCWPHVRNILCFGYKLKIYAWLVHFCIFCGMRSAFFFKVKGHFPGVIRSRRQYFNQPLHRQLRALANVHWTPGKCASNDFCQAVHRRQIALTHWGRDKMAAIFQTTFSNAFSSMKIYEFLLKFHRLKFPRGPINNIPSLV